MTTNGSTAAPLAVVREKPSAGLALTGQVQIGSMGEVFRLADALAKARNFVPRAYAGDSNAIAAAILTGIELGIGPMEALRSIHMIEGKPTMSAELMLARALRAGIRCRWLRHDAAAAELEVTRDGVVQRMSFTMDEAKAAGLAGKGNWSKFPAAMLRARCASAALRAFAPDVLGSGIYTPEELAPDTAVREDGTPIDATPARAEVVESKPAEAPRARTLDDCEDADAVLAWCREHAHRLSALEGPKRSRAHAAIEAAAVRTGLDEMTALECAGLVAPPEPTD